MQRALLAVTATLVLGLVSGPARANGRFPAAVNVRFQPGATDTIIMPVTFGLLISHDDGASFHWVCEAAIGYSGTYDPAYAVATNGDIYATTFDGLQVSHDSGCSFQPTGAPLDGSTFVSDVEIAADGRVWATTSSGSQPNDVYVAEQGGSFASSGLLNPDVWWQSVRSAPGDAQRLYVSGYMPGDASTPPAALIEYSTDGGATWNPRPVTDFTFGAQPQLFMVGVSPSNPDVVYARVAAVNDPSGDALYRSDDAGASWTKVLDMTDAIRAFLIEPDDTVIAGTVAPCQGEAQDAMHGCVKISRAGGAFEAAGSAPEMACLGQRGDGTLFACGSNWEPDNFALARSTDQGDSWQKVLQFSDIVGPLQCADGTTQHDVCNQQNWDLVCQTVGAPCPGGDGGGDAGVGGGGGGGGCCRVGGAEPGDSVPALIAVVGLLGLSRRRRRPRG